MQKNKAVFSLSVVLALLVIAGMQTLSAMDILQSFQQASPKAEKTTDEALLGRKILVVYYPRSGHTREAAQEIQAQTGGDLLEIETLAPYPVEYSAVVQQAKEEIEGGYRPALKATHKNIAVYDVIFVGSSIWWGTIAPPVASFLAANDLSGKTVVPFVTHAGSGLAQSTEAVKKACPNAQVLNGLAIEGSTANEAKGKIAKWLSELQVSE